MRPWGEIALTRGALQVSGILKLEPQRSCFVLILILFFVWCIFNTYFSRYPLLLEAIGCLAPMAVRNEARSTEIVCSGLAAYSSFQRSEPRGEWGDGGKKNKPRTRGGVFTTDGKNKKLTIQLVSLLDSDDTPNTRRLVQLRKKEEKLTPKEMKVSSARSTCSQFGKQGETKMQMSRRCCTGTWKFRTIIASILFIGQWFCKWHVSIILILFLFFFFL